jgi:hypothetical protein
MADDRRLYSSAPAADRHGIGLVPGRESIEMLVVEKAGRSPRFVV